MYRLAIPSNSDKVQQALPSKHRQRRTGNDVQSGRETHRLSFRSNEKSNTPIMADADS